MSDKVIEGTIEPDASRELIRNSDRDVQVGSMTVHGFEGVLSKAADVAGVLAAIVNEKQLFKRIRDKNHVYCEGWTTLGSMLGVCVREVQTIESPTCPGEFISVMQAIRTSDGAVIGQASHSCGPDEKDWSGRSRAARRSMAQTRATGKVMRLLFSWVMQLAGYAATPMEEVTEEPHANPEPKADAPKAQPRSERVTSEELLALITRFKDLRVAWSEPGDAQAVNLWIETHLPDVAAHKSRNSPAAWRKCDIEAAHRQLDKETEKHGKLQQSDSAGQPDT